MNNALQYRSVSILLLMVVECILTYFIVHYLLIIQQSYLINLSLSYMPTYLPLSTFDNLSETVYFIDRLYGGFIYFYLKFSLKNFTVYIFYLLWVHAGWMSEFMPPHAGGGQRTIYINIVGIWNQTQIVRIGGSHIYLLNYLTGSVPLLPLFVLFYIKFCLHDVISCSEVSQPNFYLSVNVPLLFITKTHISQVNLF